MEIEAPVVFEGGPLTFNPRLIAVFAERLELGREDIIIPDHPETIVAVGAALALEELFADRQAQLIPSQAIKTLKDAHIAVIDDAAGSAASQSAYAGKPFFETDAERAVFNERHQLPQTKTAFEQGNLPKTLRVYLGVDCGSTTTKFALLNEEGELVDSFYASNEGEPIDVAVEALRALHERYQDAGCELEVARMRYHRIRRNAVCQRPRRRLPHR